MKLKENILFRIKLTSDLQNFGLNPNEWSIEKLTALQYLVRNKYDQSFFLHGRLEFKRQKPRWKYIELISL